MQDDRPDQDYRLLDRPPDFVPEGVSDRRPAADCGPRAAAIRRAITLADLAADFVLVHWHALVLHAGLDPDRQDPVEDWVATTPGAEAFTLALPSPIVAGLAGGSRDHLFSSSLELVPLPFWEDLKDRLRVVAVLDPARGRYARSVIQRVDFPDVRALYTARGLASRSVPTVPGWAVGVDATDRSALFAVPDAGALSRGDARPSLVITPPDPATVLLGRAMLSGSHRPFARFDGGDDDPTEALPRILDRAVSRFGTTLTDRPSREG